jgi:nucleoside-diphosphate-sugar epimerase
MLIKQDLPSGIYNFADDKALSTNELITAVNRALGKKAKLWNISKKLIEKIAVFGDKVYLPLNTERLKKLTDSYVVSNRKVKASLGIEKLPVSAEDGLIKTIKSFKNK